MLLGKYLMIPSVLCSMIQAWPMTRLHFFNASYDLLLTHYGEMNTSVSTAGGMNGYFQFFIDVDLFLKFVINFDSDHLSVNFMNKTVSWCKVLEAPRYEPLVKIAYKIFSKQSHLPQKCPIEKNHLFYIQNFFFETDEFPPILPNDTNMTVTIEYWDNAKHDLLKVATQEFIAQIKHY